MAEKVATIGNVPIYKIDSIYLVILCTKTLNIPNVGTAIKKFREMYPKVMIQGINPNCIFGKEHIFEVMKIVLEANRREKKNGKKIEKNIFLLLNCNTHGL